MSEPLHLPQDEEGPTEQVRLGDTILNLTPENASAVRNAFEALAGQYGNALEQYRQQAMQTFGTQQPLPAAPQYQDPGLQIPDPDGLFQNKQAWADQFAGSLQGQLGNVRAESAQMVQGAVQAFQQELNRRDAMRDAKARHDAVMEEMLERRGLTENRRVVQAVYNELYGKLANLPLETAIDQIGAEAQQEIEKIRAGEQWSMGAAPTQTGVAARPPRTLQSSRRAVRAPAPAASVPADQLESPGGGLKPMGMIIRKRQAAIMGGSAA